MRKCNVPLSGRVVVIVVVVVNINVVRPPNRPTQLNSSRLYLISSTYSALRLYLLSSTCQHDPNYSAQPYLLGSTPPASVPAVVACARAGLRERQRTPRDADDADDDGALAGGRLIAGA
eukprot:COSAG02_NODE_1259_length_13568_cov_747.342267_6_plen_119_part_00